MDISLSKNNGFSLIEFVFIILVIGILAVYPLLKWPGTTINTAAQAQLIASDILFAQTLSMSTESCYRIIRNSATSYTITDGTSNVLLPSGSTQATLSSGITFGTWSPTTLLAFDSNGIPFSDACITPLSANANIPLTSNDSSVTITVNQTTGMVTVS